MYLHIKLNESDQNLQRILWRENSNEQISEYCLTTVTFGVNSSPFLAIATIQHHAQLKLEKFPEASHILLHDSYMDDLSSGCADTNDAIKLHRQITDVLKMAKFPLRKWVSNDEKLMEMIPNEGKEGSKVEFDDVLGKSVTTLGLIWHFECGRFGFKASTKSEPVKLTKRAILSEIASIFDPLRVLSPITIYNKIIMQELPARKYGSKR